MSQRVKTSHGKCLDGISVTLVNFDVNHDNDDNDDDNNNDDDDDDVDDARSRIGLIMMGK